MEIGCAGAMTQTQTPSISARDPPPDMSHGKKAERREAKKKKKDPRESPSLWVIV